MKTLCIYHGNCVDGFTAAWVVNKALGDQVEFHAGVYQDPPPDVTGRDVILVDFSYKRPVLLEMAGKSNSVLILDHHKSAQADLADIDLPNVTTVFDMTRSGARIAWDHFFPNFAAPTLLLHIEDYDLWRFALEGTREIQANVFSYPYDFAVWDRLMTAGLEGLRADGVAITRRHFKDIAELVKVTRRTMALGGVEVPASNLPYTFSSDAGHMLAASHPSKMGACYWDTPDGRVFSLRSTEDGPDVSAVAKQYGGGGHAHAAGFRMPIGWEGDSI